MKKKKGKYSKIKIVNKTKFIRSILITILIIIISLINSINENNVSNNIENSIYVNNVEENNTEVIDKYNYNQYIQQNISDEKMAEIYFNDFLSNFLRDPQNAFNLLESEYKQKRFAEYNEFETLIRERYSNQTIKLARYQKIDYDNYTQYICEDEGGHYYIFNETSPMQYTVMLDIYTIDLPEFVEQYNSSTEDIKVQFNIQKFFEAINNEDYTYAYNKLDETYKNNNFPTQADFEKYIKTNFYSQNKLGYTSYEKNGDLYIYKMVITNGEDSSQTIEKQFVVKLLEGTDFVMSFEK